jgi:hypothetical protein
MPVTRSADRHLGADPTATVRAFELLLEPLKFRLRFRDELESRAIDALIAYLENSPGPQVVRPVHRTHATSPQ